MTTLKAGELGRPANAIWRTIQALVARNTSPRGEAEFLKAIEGDAATPMMIRAATAGGTLASDSWAGLLAQQAVIDWLASLGPASAASQLIAMSLNIPLDGSQQITAPGISPKVINGGFVKEGDPMRATAFAVAGPTLTPHKIAFFGVLTRELAKRSRAQQIVETAMRESSALTLDATVFNDDPASDFAPAGLFYNAVPVTPTSGEGAMLADLTALAGAVAPIASGRIAFVASPLNAVRIALGLGRESPYPVLPSGALDDATVAAVAPNALAFTADPVPEISVSTEATLHLSDDPDHLSTEGGPNVVAAPVMSMFQTSQLAIRLLADVSWAKRHASAVAVASGVDWAG